MRRCSRRCSARSNQADARPARDLARAEALRQEKNSAAQAYFETHAEAWDEIRSFHAPEAAVEAAMLTAIGPGPFELLIDLGTGTGRILELFADAGERADRLRRQSRDARPCAGAACRRAACAMPRSGSATSSTCPSRTASPMRSSSIRCCIFSKSPRKAIAEAARLLKPAGRLLIVDFAPHGIEAMRDDYAHRRLGFERGLVEGWLRRGGLARRHYQAISPPKAGDGKLTVSLWLAVKAAAAGAENKHEQAETAPEGQL